jgi:hypothetical protein
MRAGLRPYAELLRHLADCDGRILWVDGDDRAQQREMHVGPSGSFLPTVAWDSRIRTASKESIQGVVAIDLRSEPLHI